jgi:hypothetical protein
LHFYAHKKGASAPFLLRNKIMMNEILKERGNNYGGFHTQANLAQTLKAIFEQHYSSTHPNDPLPNFMMEAVHMILHKLARIGNGNPYYDDSWQDIAGYSQLVVDILKEAQEKAKENLADEENTNTKVTELKGK